MFCNVNAMTGASRGRQGYAQVGLTVANKPAYTIYECFLYSFQIRSIHQGMSM